MNFDYYSILKLIGLAWLIIGIVAHAFTLRNKLSNDLSMKARLDPFNDERLQRIWGTRDDYCYSNPIIELVILTLDSILMPIVFLEAIDVIRSRKLYIRKVWGLRFL